MKFEQLGLRPEILRAVEALGYRKVTPIQEKAIPAVLDQRDVLGGAQTGTGKTAAFALPILNLLGEKPAGGKRIPRALVLTPTRELADQVAESFLGYGQFLKLRSVKIYGGVKINPQIAALRNGADIVIATPGRLLDHLNQKTIDLSGIEILVLDEADRMLDMGFIRDIRKIIGTLPVKRQNLLFSATYGSDIRTLADDILHNPVSVEVAKRNTAAETVEQKIHFVEKEQKRHLLAHLISREAWYRVLVFVKTKHGANRLALQLQKQGITSLAIHGNKSQSARNTALRQFKSGDIQALIATDIAARGLHLEDLDHVVNFELPSVPEDYIHRIGRTGRAGKSGTAVSLISSDEKSQLKRIQTLLKNPIPVEHVSDFKPVAVQPQDKAPQKPAAGNTRSRNDNSYRRRSGR